MNSGDIYYNNNVITNILKILTNNNHKNIIFGKLAYFDLIKISRYWDYQPKKSARLNPYLIPHPAAFIKKKLLEKYDFYNENYQVSSDLDFFLKCEKDISNEYFFTSKLIVFMRHGGLSTNLFNLPKKIFEDLSILFMNYSIFFIFFYVYKLILKFPSLILTNQNSKLFSFLLSRLFDIAKK